MPRKTKRIIPCLDVDDGRVVKGKKFKNIEDVANPVDLARAYDQAGADELVFYDITASSEGRNIFIGVVEQVAATISIPFTVGGGIRTLEDIERVFQAGADKVSINSAAVQHPNLIASAAKKFGRERVVLSIDAKETARKKWDVFINGGRKNTGMEATEWARKGEELGAGELVVNSMDEDGVKNGYNVLLTETIANAVNIPVVASGGAGTKEHFKVILEHGADAALAASVFHYGEITIPELKDYLANEQIPIRRHDS
ncbi:MAG TPA: imidazole glycerol phosphate synthase subunit HisF [Bacillota bacterium]